MLYEKTLVCHIAGGNSVECDVLSVHCFICKFLVDDDSVRFYTCISRNTLFARMVEESGDIIFPDMHRYYHCSGIVGNILDWGQTFPAPFQFCKASG